MNLSDSTRRAAIHFGMWAGALLAFANLPGYFVAGILKQQPWWGLKMALLFAVAGASSGMWIAWQAYRAVHPEKRFWPQYSLATLLIVVIAWGALMGVFAPQMK